MTPFMASEQQVKRYLAYWFQLGKKVVIRNGATALQTQQVFAGDRYSDEFENIWQQILSPESGECHLEGTNETIRELLTPEWSVSPCVRCAMPVPVKIVGMPPELCPCSDLAGWPNTELPAPREAISSQDRLKAIRDRLQQADSNARSLEPRCGEAQTQECRKRT